ncbi:ubiquitin-conjugating enzyme/RWD-like protein [Chlamydoabsidia padenii]|nr:ubiquitin-conjugating enzyme/RWD-like protein [Chlamydoabsidia padenii]
MATKAAFRRLTKEYMELQKNPPPYIFARPTENNILEWHYVIQGPPDTPYHGGEYYGRLTFPSDYPYKPPSIRMSTPSGRFQPDTRLCLTMSDFHPSLWNPSWSVATILNGLLSFMTTEENTTGSIKTSDAEKRIYATRSHLANRRMIKFREIFPDLCKADKTTLSDNILLRQRQRKVPPTTTRHHIEPSNQNTITRTVSRWVFVLIVFLYLILSKLASRSSSASDT